MEQPQDTTPEDEYYLLGVEDGRWEMGGEDQDCGVINLLISGNITPTYRREENTSDGVQLRLFGKESHNISVRQLLFRPFCANHSHSCNCKGIKRMIFH